eukprot:GFKZ01009163.1.p1 GENE.GFKZ01009163.1~~GFKZ01009163.1.p1  ORF type:complete len:469 (+),score=47.32 GFKZ01009163.1:170-1576(+)
MAQKERQNNPRKKRVHSSRGSQKIARGPIAGRKREFRSTAARIGSSAGTVDTSAAPAFQDDASASNTNKRQRIEGQNWCRRCQTQTTSRWRTGPDGLRTLCSRCAFSYAEMKIKIFRDAAGNLSATKKEGNIAVTISGFETHPDGTRNLLRPLIAAQRSAQRKTKARRPAERSSSEGSLQDDSPWCRKCGTRESSRWRTGPDGFKTLCTPCSKRYVRHQLVLFQSSDGRVSAEAKPGWKPVAITGFQISEKDGTRILSTPAVRLMTTKEVSTSPDTCVEYVPAPPCQISTSLQQSESRTSPSITVNIQKEETPKQDEVEGTGACPGPEQALSETSRTLRRIIDANENEACKALLDLERTYVVVPDPATMRADAENQEMTHSVKASCKTAGGVFLVRRFTISSEMAYDEFANHLRDLFKISGSVDITYEDDEGDSVTVSSGLELRVMMSIAKANAISPIRVTVVSESQV